MVTTYDALKHDPKENSFNKDKSELFSNEKLLLSQNITMKYKG